ncbi:MAG: DUF4258 domain-containing protein [Candidatus Muirbacterium halophilum]|nr:DUF4258 domain-containing protein [Candidatus Muirbacterium halophilum]MCK9476158.1 DUF4258 domain-containing protein [Candidatus Muirbacterium halophilum]
MNITFSEHARERCFQRDISDVEIERILERKQIYKILDVLGKTVIKEKYKGKILNIVVAGTIASAIVITAY